MVWPDWKVNFKANTKANKIVDFKQMDRQMDEQHQLMSPGLKGPPGASSNRIVRPSGCLSVILSRLQTKCNI